MREFKLVLYFNSGEKLILFKKFKGTFNRQWGNARKWLNKVANSTPELIEGESYLSIKSVKND